MFHVEVVVDGIPQQTRQIENRKVLPVQNNTKFKVNVYAPAEQNLYAVQLFLNKKDITGGYKQLDTKGLTTRGKRTFVSFEYMIKSDSDGTTNYFPMQFSHTENKEDEESRPSQMKQNWDDNYIEIVVYQGMLHTLQYDLFNKEKSLPVFDDNEQENIKIKTGTSIGARAGDLSFVDKPFFPKGERIVSHNNQIVFREKIFYRDRFFIDVRYGEEEEKGLLDSVFEEESQDQKRRKTSVPEVIVIDD